MSPKIWMTIACLLGALGVTLGAYQAHGLEKSLEKRGLEPAEVQKQVDNCGTAVKYQMFHVFAIMGVGVWFAMRPHPMLHAAGALFLLGVAGFSGGLYLGVFTGDMIHWAIVPLGGLMLIIAWLTLAITVWIAKPQ